MKSVLATLVFLACAASSPGQDAAAPGRLCVGSSEDIFQSESADCRQALGSAAVKASDTNHLFSFCSADGKRLFLGRAAQEVESARFTLRLDSDSKRWPVAVDLRVKADKGPLADWRYRLSKYEIEFAAVHHEPLTLRIDGSEGKALGTVRLRALPVLNGKVLSRKNGAPVPAAVVSSGAKTLELTDGRGEFQHELAPGEEVPATLTISAAGFGSRSVAVPKLRTDQTLPDIELDAGGGLRVHVELDREKHGHLLVDLTRVEGRRRTAAGHGEIGPKSSDWEKNDLDPGSYVVTISGDGPLEHMARPATVIAGTTVDLDVKPTSIAFTITLLRSGGPLSDADVTLQSSDYKWVAPLKTGLEGTATADLWQAGRFSAAITSGALREPYLYAGVIDDAPEAEWRVEIPSGTIAGRVSDAASGAPIKGAQVTLDSSSSDNVQRSIGAETDDDGRFHFESVTPGAQSVYAEKEHYAKSSPQSFNLSSDGDRREIAIALTPSSRYPIRVVGPEGLPLAGVLIARVGVSPNATPATDASGRADVDIDGSGTLLAILPPAGSFALHRILPGSVSPTEPVTIVVPNGNASLLIRTLSTEQDAVPISNARILLRYNHELLDPALLQLIGQLRRLTLATDSRGQLFLGALPPGAYELWPYASLSEVNAIMSRNMPASAVVPVVAGSYEATLRIAAQP
jgi:hypothetical protein